MKSDRAIRTFAVDGLLSPIRFVPHIDRRSKMQQVEEARRTRNPRRQLDATGGARRAANGLAGWALAAGGLAFFIGGGMHPSEDPVDVTVKENLQVQFADAAWYPAHSILLVAMVLMATGLVFLARRGALSRSGGAQMAGGVAAVAAVLAAVDMALHLVVASEADKLAAGQSSPLTDIHLIAETLTVPAFAFSIVGLALIGAATRTLGNWVIALFGVVGGVSYGLAAATILFTDELNFLFPGAGAIGVWAFAVGVWLLLRARAEASARA